MKIYVMDNGIDSWASDAIMSGVQEVLRALRGGGSVINWGRWRSPQWISDRTLVAYQSVDWYVAQSRSRGNGSTKQVHASDILTALWNEPWRTNNPHIDVFVVREDIYDDECNWCFGLGSHGVGCVISTARWGREGHLAGACVASMAIHELAHALGLLPDHRVQNVEYSLGKHCTNEGCVMRQGLTQEASVQITRERLAIGRAFCPQCLANLRDICPLE